MSSSSIETEYNEINLNDEWFAVFQSIRKQCDDEAKDKEFTLNESKKLENRKYNRYRDVNPYDHSRIVLHRGDSDYINANLIKLERANRKYILTQGPLQKTVGHFWLMIWEQNSKAILMLNKIIEKNQVKCHMYWPEHIGEEHLMNLTDVGLTVEYLKYEEYNHFCTRIFRLTDTESTKSREIIQFHYTTWPDFGIPSSPIAFLQFLKKVRDSGALSSDVGPAVVHCSAGIGRSGTFCLVDCCLVLIDNEGENKVSVQEILLELRRYRMGLIQTVDQLYFSYQAIIEGMKHLKDPSFNDYEEVPITKEEDIEDIPPPLPPPRTHSLIQGPPISKPLPLIPNSESLHEDLMSHNFNEQEAINNLVNIEKSKQYAKNNLDRPLPPLPRENSLEKVDESSSNNESESEIEENDSDLNEENIIANEKLQVNHITESEHNTTTQEINSFDADATLPSSPDVTNSFELNSESTTGTDSDKLLNAELRRRKRAERTTSMEDKIREMKRKQKLCEDKARESPKKRRQGNNEEAEKTPKNK